jgi:hypothetical protein
MPMYIPGVGESNPLRRYRLGQYVAVLAGDIKSPGQVSYLYILSFVRDGENEPSVYVASEVDRFSFLGGGSHVLGVFDAAGHHNLGASDDWADLDRFATEALTVGARYLGVTAPPELEHVW